MKQVIFAFPGNELLAESISAKLNAGKGEFEMRRFPDAESYIRLTSNVAGREAILLCTLYQPDDKALPLFFLAKILRDAGSKKITLVAPYLSYMRQDKQFNPGEAVTSRYFAQFISSFIDEMITVDPHLHRYNSLSDLYSVPCKSLQTSLLISRYIKERIKNPLIIGPDSESKQWVSEVAKAAKAPFIVLQKERSGDKQVRISIPELENFKDRTPVLVDDIISTASTMIETILHLKNARMEKPVCIGIHPVFAGEALEKLQSAGAGEILSSNSIIHSTNKIDISDILVDALNKPYFEKTLL